MADRDNGTDLQKECNGSQCVDWNGPTTRDGYGIAALRGTTTTAHRAAWIVAHGPVPEGMQVDHICRNRLCVNVDHLQILAPLDNTRRAWEHLTHCRRGHPLEGMNLHIQVDRFGWTHRSCKICRREATARWEQRRRSR